MPPERARPPSALTSPASVSAHGWRSVAAPTARHSSLSPPPPAICQPPSTTASQPLAVLLLRGAPSSPSEHRRRLFHLRGISTRRPASSGASFLFSWGGIQVFASFALQLPFKTYGENGQTSSYKPNFSAADSRCAQIPAGKPAEAAFPPRWRYV